MTWRTATAIPCLLAAVGCSEPKAPAGYPTAPAHFDRLARSGLQPLLLDAESARLRVTRDPRPAELPIVATVPAVTEKGWAACYAVNAKNALGAYAGERVYMFFAYGPGAPRISVNSMDGPPAERRAIADECRKPAVFEAPPVDHDR